MTTRPQPPEGTPRFHDNYTAASQYPPAEASLQPSTLHEQVAALSTADKYQLWIMLGDDLGMNDPGNRVVDQRNAAVVFTARLLGQAVRPELLVTGAPAAPAGSSEAAPQASLEERREPAIHEVLGTQMGNLPVTLHYVEADGERAEARNEAGEYFEEHREAKLDTNGNERKPRFSRLRTVVGSVAAEKPREGDSISWEEAVTEYLDEEIPEVLVFTAVQGKDFGAFTGQTKHPRAGEPAVLINYGAFARIRLRQGVDSRTATEEDYKGGETVGLSIVAPESFANELLNVTLGDRPAIIRTLMVNFAKRDLVEGSDDYKEWLASAPPYKSMREEQTAMYVVSDMAKNEVEGMIYPSGKPDGR